MTATVCLFSLFFRIRSILFFPRTSKEVLDALLILCFSQKSINSKFIFGRSNWKNKIDGFWRWAKWINVHNTAFKINWMGSEECICRFCTDTDIVNMRMYVPININELNFTHWNIQKQFGILNYLCVHCMMSTYVSSVDYYWCCASQYSLCVVYVPKIWLCARSLLYCFNGNKIQIQSSEGFLWKCTIILNSYSTRI